MEIREIICTLLGWYFYVILARVLMSWIPLSRTGAFGAIANVINAVTDPVMEPVRRVLPPVRMGNSGLDLSPIVVIIGLQFLTGAICN